MVECGEELGWKTYVVPDIAFACAAECLNGKGFTLFHLSLVAALDNRHRLAAVDAIPADAVAVEVADAFYGVCLPLDLALVALHDLLDRSANVRHAHIDTCFLNTCVGSILARIDQVVIGWVEVHGEGRVDNASVDVHTKVDLHDVLLLEYHLVARVGRIVGSAVVDAQARRETHTGLERIALLETLVSGESAHRVLDALCNLGERHARLDPLLCPLSDLTVHLGAASVVGEEILVHAVEVALLLAGRAVCVLVEVVYTLSLGIGIVEVDFVDGHPRRSGLHFGP